MPGVLLIESMAQTAGWLVIAATRFTRMPFLFGVKEAKLRTFVTPGQALSLSAELLHEGSGFAVTKANVSRPTDKPICDAEISFRVVDFPNAEFRAHMDEWAARLQFPHGGAQWLTRAPAWITGVGIVSCLGEGPDAHWQRLSAGKPGADTQTFAPYVVHPIAPLEFDKQIPKKGDQRQMEPWQRIGTYAAGLALDAAGVKGNAELLARMDMIVAAGGGERDYAVDSAILTGLAKADNPDAFLNERLMSDLRPTLFLAQLSNLLAGNISIVHGVTGSSRTFMGEEAAGVDAVRIALARIAAGTERHRAGRRRAQRRAQGPA